MRELELDDAALKILPAVLRASLQRRAMMKPLLDLARRSNYKYRWGYPLVVTFRRDQRSFTLRTPESLPALFQFLEVEPFEVLDWLGPLLRLPHRPGTASSSGRPPHRPQQSQRRPQATSPEDAREA